MPIMRREKLVPLIIGIGVALSVLLLKSWGLFFGFEAFLGDQLLDPIGVSPEIVIVAIDDESIGKIGQWPWPREEYAKLLAVLGKNPPKRVGIDVVFSEPSRIGKRDDEKLASALAHSKFSVTLAKEGSKLLPLPIFDANESRGADVHLIVDPDGVVRRFDIGRGAGIFAWHIMSASQSTGAPYYGRIAWAGPPGTFRRISFWRVINDPEISKSLAGKILLVGATATDLHDEQITAIKRGVAMPGVEIQANLVNMLVKNTYISDTSKGYGGLDYFLIIIAVLLPVLIFIFLAGMLRPILGSGVFFAVMIIALIIAWNGNIALPVFYPSLAWLFSTAGQVLYRYFGAERSRREIKSLFGKYVSNDVLNELLKNPSQVKLGGEERDVTVLFSDVRDFTTLSESMTPADLTHFLNIYLSSMTDIVLAGKGVIDKYIGDAVMAFWGAPLVSTTHAMDAILSATGMIDALEILNNENEKAGLPRITIGVGLNSGKVVAGNMGSNKRFDYTLMGDTVNLSSRLESLTKYYGVEIIASTETVGRVNRSELLQMGIIIREIDKVRVKGKKETVKIFEIIAPSRRENMGKIMNWFNAARGFYYKSDWDKCLKMLADIEKIVPNDGPTRVLRERCLQFKVVSPGDWDGIYEHKSK